MRARLKILGVDVKLGLRAAGPADRPPRPTRPIGHPVDASVGGEVVMSWTRPI